jgi:type 1 glutamine amidotransferase
MTVSRKWLYALLLVLVLLAGLMYYAGRALGIIQFGPYEHEPPEIGAIQRPAVLVLSKANGYVHVDALPAGQAMLKRLAQEHGWGIYLTGNAAVHNVQDLAKFDVVVWNNVSGDVLTTEQRAALKAWLEQGGGWVGIHAAGGDFWYKWSWYVDTLIGAQFVGHTMDPQFQDAHVMKSESVNSITAHLPDRWVVEQEEWYAFDANPRDKGYEILLTLDESSYITQGESIYGSDTMDGEHPIAWRHELGQGRVFYSAIGHQGATYRIPEFEALIGNAIRWAMAPQK